MEAEPVVIERLPFRDIDPGAQQVARVERLDQGVLVDDRPPGRVDQDRPATHPGQRLGVDHVVGRRVQVAMEADEMALLEQLLEAMDPPDPQRLVGPLGDQGIVEDDVEAECLGPERGRGADPPATDQPDRLAAEPGRSIRRPMVPPPARIAASDGCNRRTSARRNMRVWSATSSVP